MQHFGQQYHPVDLAGLPQQTCVEANHHDPDWMSRPVAVICREIPGQDMICSLQPVEAVHGVRCGWPLLQAGQARALSPMGAQGRHMSWHGLGSPELSSWHTL